MKQKRANGLRLQNTRFFVCPVSYWLNSQNGEKSAVLGDNLTDLLVQLEFSAVKEMFHICAVQFGSRYLFMATEHLKCGYYERETEF